MGKGEEMAGNTARSAKAICPYYKSATKMRILCESNRDYDTGLFFRSEERVAAWRMDYCDCYCWRGCPVAIMITEDVGFE